MSSVNSVAVLGAGQMGAGIAQVMATYGYETLLYDINATSLTNGISGIKAQWAKMVEKGKITKEQVEKSTQKLKAAQTLADFSQADLVIEAVTEKVDLKLKIFTDLDSTCKKGAILATNTSSISITKIAASTKRPELIVGMHFMNPVPIMKLVELIRGLQTAEETYSTVRSIVEKIEKTPVLAIDSAGFIVNRILCPMINEAIFLLQEGVKAEDIDNAMKLGTNQPMGPLALADFVGLDTLLSILQILHRELGDDKYRPCPLLIKYVEAGWYGKKTKRGFYSY